MNDSIALIFRCVSYTNDDTERRPLDKRSDGEAHATRMSWSAQYKLASTAAIACCNSIGKVPEDIMAA